MHDTSANKSKVCICEAGDVRDGMQTIDVREEASSCEVPSLSAGEIGKTGGGDGDVVGFDA